MRRSAPTSVAIGTTLDVGASVDEKPHAEEPQPRPAAQRQQRGDAERDDDQAWHEASTRLTVPGSP